MIDQCEIQLCSCIVCVSQRAFAAEQRLKVQLQQQNAPGDHVSRSRNVLLLTTMKCLSVSVENTACIVIDGCRKNSNAIRTLI